MVDQIAYVLSNIQLCPQIWVIPDLRVFAMAFVG
jgi:hypothetical protein